MLKNAVISAEMEFPMCQDTGTAIVMGKKGQRIWADFNESEAISKGVYNAYVQDNLRYSQNAPLNMFEEKNTGCNLPAQIDLYATKAMPTNSFSSPKGAGPPTKSTSTRKTRLC